MNEITEAIIQIAAIAVEIYFIYWTISRIRRLRDKLELQQERIDLLMNERTENYIKSEKMKEQIEELKKSISKEN